MAVESSWVRFRYDFANALSLAVDSIRAHRLRSFLTLLGVIIGVGSVILVGAAIEGLGAYAEQSTAKAFGSESYLIAQIAAAGNMSRKEYFEKLRRNKEIRMEDARYLQSVNGEHTLYSPYRQRTIDVKRDELTCEDTSIIGVAAVMPQVRDITLVDGRFFTEQEERTRQYVAVIGQEIVTTLFPDGASPVGRDIKIGGLDFRVIGVQEKMGSVFGRSQDKSAYVPVTAFNRMFGVGRGMAVFARPKPGSGLSLLDSLDLTRVALRTRFKARAGEIDNFDTLTPDAIRGFIDTMLALISAVVVPVTCISLVVGGIVIMNIMLVSVTERTREIGIRLSLGARRLDIMLQVLIEAVLMAALGGLIGVGAGALLTEVIARVFEINMRVTLAYVALAVGVSSAVGIASGWYPASRASKLDPVEALRAE